MNILNIQWYPGHMTKATRQIKELLKQIDVVIELVDARCPKSSHNPELKKLCENKKILTFASKQDLALPVPFGYSIKTNIGLDKIKKELAKCKKELDEKYAKKGYINKKMRVLVVGIPNVGKSAFINKMAKRKALKIENRAGVTKDIAWLDAGGGIEFADTPGILPPKIESITTGLYLAFIGSVKDSVLPTGEVEAFLACYLALFEKEKLENFYKIKIPEFVLTDKKDIFGRVSYDEGLTIGYQITEQIKPKNILNDFRKNAFGNINLIET